MIYEYSEENMNMVVELVRESTKPLLCGIFTFGLEEFSELKEDLSKVLIKGANTVSSSAFTLRAHYNNGSEIYLLAPWAILTDEDHRCDIVMFTNPERKTDLREIRMAMVVRYEKSNFDREIDPKLAIEQLRYIAMNGPQIQGACLVGAKLLERYVTAWEMLYEGSGHADRVRMREIMRELRGKN